MQRDTFDSDTLCIWAHPTNPVWSTIIAVDPETQGVMVYDMSGAVIQRIPAKAIQLIDIRYGIKLGGNCVDLVAMVDPVGAQIRAYQVDAETRKLLRVDDQRIKEGPADELALYRDASGRLFAYLGLGDEDGVIRQIQLVDNGQGQVSALPGDWRFPVSGLVELVSDDPANSIFVVQRNGEVWRVNAADSLDRSLATTIDGDPGELQPEGLSIFQGPASAPQALVFSQKAPILSWLQDKHAHRPIGNFKIEGVQTAAEIDSLNLSLSTIFPRGIFVFYKATNLYPEMEDRWEVMVIETSALGARHTCPN